MNGRGPNMEQVGFVSDETRQLQATVVKFMQNQVAPAESVAAFDAYSLPPETLNDLQTKARQAGLWCIGSPAEHGGAGMTFVQQAIVVEEAAKCRMGAYVPAAGAFGWDPPNVIFSGTEAQISAYAVPTIEKGEKTFVAITEPSGGSDPARSIATSAQKTPKGWVINGTKVFITGIEGSRWGIVFARTNGSAGAAGISCFIVETDSPGISCRPIPVMRSWSPQEVVFTDCLVPEDALLGNEGEGFGLANEWLVHARIPYAAASLGVAQAALDLTISYSRERMTFGSRLADKQAVQWMVADSEMELRAARLLTLDAAQKADDGAPVKVASSIAKTYATEAAGRVVDRCIQVFGAIGVSEEMPLERWYRELRIRRIGEGPSEIHRMVVARSLIGAASKEQ